MDEPGARAQHNSHAPGPGKRKASIALFPGSFKPAHAAHIHAIRHLLGKTELTEVIVIISNRCRLIPGTGFALDADAARRILRTMLRGADISMQRIRIEIAEHRATAHALDYFARANPGDTLLFCVGTADFDSRDDRFARIAALSKASGISARIEVLPRAPVDVHATELRRFMTAGNEGRSKFCSALPPELSELQKAAVWAACRDSMRPVGEIVQPKIGKALAGRYDISLHDLDCCDPQSIDPEFRFRQKTGDDFIVKYAGETTVAGAFDERMAPKPARRLAVEKRVLRHLAGHLDASIWRPAVDFHDKQKRILVLTRPAATASTIEAELRSGTFDAESAATAANLLSRLHQCPLPQEPFWGERTADQDHWTTLIDGLGRRGNRKLLELHRSDLRRNLPAASAEPCVLHLNFVPKYLWRDQGGVGIEHFERAGSFGDPSYDVATFVAEYIVSGMQCDAMSRCLDAFKVFLTTYTQRQRVIDAGFSYRMLTYVAFCLLTIPASRTIQSTSGHVDPIAKTTAKTTAKATAIAMLEWIDANGSAPPPEVADSFLQCVSTAAAGLTDISHGSITKPAMLRQLDGGRQDAT